MPAAGHSSPLPASAAVLEFICLFTHDLRRKQKRWQDGRLKYHSFNNRVMVYDERGNFVGDMHWRRDYDLDEGEEVELERGGVIVQVQDLVSRTEQDLSELLDKRVKEKEQRQIQAAARSPAPSAALSRSVPPDHFQVRHRPLHRVIGTPSGHHGRAVVSRESPYEQRRQPAASPDQRAVKKRKYENPPPSKSGYAQALFGQTLTLSAVPRSSISDRQWSNRDSGPSSSAEATAPDLRDELSPALREQPRSSRHFNQPAERPPAVRLHKERRLVYDLEGDEDRRLSQNDHVQHQRRASLVCDNVIEIDDPRPVSFPMKPVRPKVAEKGGLRAARVQKQTEERPSTTSSRQHAGFRAVERIQSDVPLHEKGSEKPEALSKSKKAKSAAPKPTTNKATGETGMLRKNQELEYVESIARQPSEPVTELRIKSSKKRGLLMMSEIPKKQRETSAGRSNASRPPSCASNEEANAGQDKNEVDPVRWSSPQPQKRPKTKELGQNEKPAAQRTISTELGENNDPFQSQSLVTQPLTGFTPGRSAGDNVEDPDLTELMQPSENDEQGSELDLQMGVENVAAKLDVETLGVTTNSLSAHGRNSDPYRLPSSSPDQQSELPPWALPNSDTKAPPSRGRRAQKSAIKTANEVNALNSDQRKTVIKQSRKARRNILLEDDEELELPQMVPGQADAILDESLDTDLDNILIPSKPQAKAMNRMTNNQSRPAGTVVEEDSLDLDADEATSKEQAKSKKATTTHKRHSKAQEKTNYSGSEDDHPAKRRRSTRKTSNRMAEVEETPLPTEQDNTQDEPSSKPSRKRKKPTAVEGRPRLTKIKNNVKSREVIGFNPAALQTPRGLREIGVPFRILSSPAEESMQKRVDGYSVANVSVGPMIYDDVDEGVQGTTSNPVEAPAEGEEMTIDLTRAEARDENPRVGLEEPLGTPLVADRFNYGDQIGHLDLDEPFSKTPMEPAASPTHDFGLKDACTRHISEREPGKELGACRDGLPLNEARVLLMPHELQSRNEEQRNSVVKRATVIAKALQESKSRDSPSSAVSTDRLPVEMPMPAVQERVSIVVQNGVSERSSVRAVLEPKATTESTSTSGSIGPPRIHSASEKPVRILSQQISRGSDDNTANEAPQRAKALETPSTGCTVAANISELGQKQVPSLRRRPSSLTPVSKAKSDVAHTEVETLLPQDDQGEPHSRAPPAQEPSSIVPQQPCGQPLANSSEAMVAAERSDTTQITQTVLARAAPIQGQKPFGQYQAVSVARRINNIAANRAQPGEACETKSDNSRNPARILNPASRGRKAALKSDAAGPAPQRLLPPTQPSAVVPISTADLASTPLEEVLKEPERPKKKMTFPGFQSAKGEGPWSREAFDLLESGRPG